MERSDKMSRNQFTINKGCSIFALVPLVIADFLLIFAVIPSSGWLWGSTKFEVSHCQAISACVNGTVYFQAQVNPFFATVIFNMGSLMTQSVAWSDLNTKDLCTNTNSSLYTGYAAPNKLCNDNGDFVFPSVITSIQALTVLTIIFAMLQIPFAFVCGHFKTTCASMTYYIWAIATFSFAVAAIALWDSFNVVQNYLSRTATVYPVWNATVVYKGEVLISGKYSSHYESSYGITFSDSLIGATVFGTVQSEGRNLWISAIAFMGISLCCTLFGCCSSLRETNDLNDGGSFGSGAYIPAPPSDSRNTAAPDFHEILPPSDIPTATAGPDVGRPVQPPPPPPPDVDIYALKKEW